MLNERMDSNIVAVKHFPGVADPALAVVISLVVVNSSLWMMQMGRTKRVDYYYTLQRTRMSLGDYNAHFVATSVVPIHSGTNQEGLVLQQPMMRE